MDSSTGSGSEGIQRISFLLPTVLMTASLSPLEEAVRLSATREGTRFLAGGSDGASSEGAAAPGSGLSSGAGGSSEDEERALAAWGLRARARLAEASERVPLSTAERARMKKL